MIHDSTGDIKLLPTFNEATTFDRMVAMLALNHISKRKLAHTIYRNFFCCKILIFCWKIFDKIGIPLQTPFDYIKVGFKGGIYCTDMLS